MKRRIAVYFFYDSDGIVDQYVEYYLAGLADICSGILVVSNVPLETTEREKLRKSARWVLERENDGFDAWAYKEVLEHIGWDTLSEYEELIITNSTVFGPLYPFAEAFGRMEAVSVDFWGMMKRRQDENQKGYGGGQTIYGYVPEFITSNFWVIRSGLLRSKVFRKFWEELPPIETYHDSCNKFEAVFTKQMADSGYTYTTYDTEFGGLDLCYSYTPITSTTASFHMISQVRMPIIRKKVFFDDYQQMIGTGSCMDTENSYLFIRDHTGYDVSLIWSNLLRVCNQIDLYRRMNWNYIFPLRQDIPFNKLTYKTAVIAYISGEDKAPLLFEKLSEVPDLIDLYIITDTDTAERLIGSDSSIPFRCQWHIFNREGRDAAALLIAGKEIIQSMGYHLVCYVHDASFYEYTWEIVPDQFRKRSYDSLLGSPSVIADIHALFEHNGNMGIVALPPETTANSYLMTEGNWSGNYLLVEKWLGSLEINALTSPRKRPMAAYGGMFWFRPEALAPLFNHDWTKEEFPSEPYLYPQGTLVEVMQYLYVYAAQDAGFYTVYGQSEGSARAELTAMRYELAQINSRFVGRGNTSLTWRQFFMRIGSMDFYCERVESLSPYILFKNIIKKVCPNKAWNMLRQLKHQWLLRKQQKIYCSGEAK